MNISHFFIDRPIFACVISLVILLAGAVATPIEKQVNGVDKMLYISTSCTSDGSVKITVTFEVGTDPDMATVLVQNRVNVASAKLPEDCAIIEPVLRRKSNFSKSHKCRRYSAETCGWYACSARCTPHVFLAKLSRWAKQNPCQAESIS